MIELQVVTKLPTMITSIVLAGGRSTRLGREKALEEIGGERLIDRAVARVAPLSTEVILVMRPGQPTPPLPTEPEVKTVTDRYPGKGSLGGIYTGLYYSSSFHNLAIACDMPFLNVALLHHLIELSPDFDVVIPLIKGNAEPLHAVYSKNCLAPIEALLKRGRLRIVDFFPSVRVRYMGESEVDQFDPQHLSFFNINTEEDLAKARIIAKQEAHQASIVLDLKETTL